MDARLDAPASVDVSALRGGTQTYQFWTSNALSSIANDIVGTSDMHVYTEDDPTEWATFMPPNVDSTNVLGFVLLYVPAFYHDIFLSPALFPIFRSWFTSGTPQGNEFPFAVAAMSLIHESFHWRLYSGDESTVNACAIKYLPYYLQRDFNVPQTITQTTTQQVPQTTTTTTPVTQVVIKKQRVRVQGKWITKTSRVTVTTNTTTTTTTYVTQTVTANVANPLFDTIVADAKAFYSQQPPPYNAGTCTV